jgi:hypothetical protein
MPRNAKGRRRQHSLCPLHEGSIHEGSLMARREQLDMWEGARDMQALLPHLSDAHCSDGARSRRLRALIRTLFSENPHLEIEKGKKTNR